MPWLLWGFERQTYEHRELVVVDSSPEPWSINRANVRVLAAPPGSNVPTKRNLALDAARGDYIAWFDDDDWQHPERLERLVESLREDHVIVGSSRSWFVDLVTLGTRPYDGRGSLIFNTALFRTDEARSVRFDERCHRASDTPWLRELRGRNRGRELQLDCDTLTLWLCHEQNISNPRKKRHFSTPLSELFERIGADAWEATTERLEALRRSLPEPVTAPNQPTFAAGAESRLRSGRTKDRSFARGPLGMALARVTDGDDEIHDDAHGAHGVLPTVGHVARRADAAVAVKGTSLVVLTTPNIDVGPWTKHWEALWPLPLHVLSSKSPEEELLNIEAHLRSTTHPFVLWLRPKATFANVSREPGATLWLREGQRALERWREVTVVTAHPGAPVGPLGTPRSLPSHARLSWDGAHAAFRWNAVPDAYGLARRDWLQSALETGAASTFEDRLDTASRRNGCIALALGTPGFHATPSLSRPLPGRTRDEHARSVHRDECQRSRLHLPLSQS
jgi:hypothetical protein